MSSQEARRDKRLATHYRVFFGEKGPEYLGMVKNLSKSGIAISAKTLIKPGTKLSLQIEADGKKFSLKGTVTWGAWREIPDTTPSYDLGIRYDKPDETYLVFVERLINDFEEQRNEPRFEKIFRLRFHSPKELMRQYTTNISKGGMFVRTSQVLSLNSEVELDIELEDIGKTLHAQGVVRSVITKDKAEEMGIEPGFGLELIKFEGKDRAIFYDYINRHLLAQIFE